MTVQAVATGKPNCTAASETPLSDFGSKALNGLFESDLCATGFQDMEEPPSPNRSRNEKPGLGSTAFGHRCVQDGEREADDPGKARSGEWMTDLRWKSICSKLLSISEEAISDVDLLTLLLSYYDSEANARKSATQLIHRFDTFGNVVSARCTQIISAAQIPPETVDFFKLVRAAGARLAREEISNRPILDSWDKLLPYLRSVMAHLTEEQFRILFLDRRNVLIADEVQSRGTIDHTPVYPREVARRALELDSSAIIMAHNHPSNSPKPSKGDIAMTQNVHDTLERLGIVLHDHIIVSRSGHSSFRCMGLLGCES